MYNEPRKWRAICPDGTIRTATETREPDVWFAANARISYHGKTVQGSVSAYSDAVSIAWEDRGEGRRDKATGERTVWEFYPYEYLTNGHMFKEG